MIADDLFPAHARPLWLDRSRQLSRALAPLPSLGLAWWLADQMLSTAIWVSLIGYCLAHLTLIGLQRGSRTQALPIVQGAIGVLRILVDVLLALVLVHYATVLGDAIYPLYLLLGLRVLATYQQQPTATIIPFLLGPAYI